MCCPRYRALLIPANNGEVHQGFTDFHQQMPLDPLTVWVHSTGAPDSHWPDKLTRVTGSLDPATRTIQAVITVAEPYRNANPPARPPLVRNMFVRATIRDKPGEQPLHSLCLVSQ